MKNQEKQKRILKILKDYFSDKRLDKITEDDFDFSKLSKVEAYWFMESVWIDLGKTRATRKELENGIHNVYTLFVIDNLRRHGLIKLSKEGFFDKTKLGKEVNKLVNTQRRGKTHQ